MLGHSCSNFVQNCISEVALVKAFVMTVVGGNENGRVAFGWRTSSLAAEVGVIIGAAKL